IEAEFGAPQDIEWCFENRELFVVQARPITTLFPVPERWREHRRDEDPGLRVFISLGHVQVMTDVMSPLAHGIWRRFVPLRQDAGGRSTIVRSAGGRLFVDPTDLLRLPRAGRVVPRVLSLVDARTSAAIAAVRERPSFRAASRQIGRLRLLHGASFFARRI